MSKATRDLFTQAVEDQRLLEQNALSPLNWPGSASRFTHLFASPVYAVTVLSSAPATTLPRTRGSPAADDG